METGPLTKKVLEYSDRIRRLVPTAGTPNNWDPVAELVAVDEFTRYGPFLEVQDWQGATEMMTAWASGIQRFETTTHRITELGNLVYYEIEERHYFGDELTRVNSLNVYEFNDEGKVRRLDVFIQKAL